MFLIPSLHHKVTLIFESSSVIAAVPMLLELGADPDVPDASGAVPGDAS
jgi:hypothetical protein